MARLLLLRHAESEWNSHRRWQGWADPPLSPDGERQAVAAGRLLGRSRFVAAVASDLQRAVATAQLAAAPLGLPDPVGIDPGLREYDIGDWSGLTRHEIEARWPGALEEWRGGRMATAPGGERRDAFTSRIVAAVARVGAAHPIGAVVVITHGGVIVSLERLLGGGPRRVAHLAGRWLEVGRPVRARGAGVALRTGRRR